MTLFELAAEVWSRGGELRAIDGRIRYRGLELAADDPIRAAIVEHRATMLALVAEHERRREARVGAARPEVAA